MSENDLEEMNRNLLNVHVENLMIDEDDTSSINESESEFNDADESIANGNENDINSESSRKRSTIGLIKINNSNDVTIGDKIIYQGPVTIHQHVFNRNEVTNNNVNENLEILNLPGENENLNIQMKSPFIKSFYVKSSLVFTMETAGPLRIVERNEWFARSPEKELERLELPAIRVIIAYTHGKCPTTHVRHAFNCTLNEAGKYIPKTNIMYVTK